MELRELGRTGLKVSAIGLGGIPVQRISFSEAQKVIEAAIDRGINFIDTARGYTDSETKFGKVLPKWRDKVIIATKSMARTKDEMANEIEKSLTDLGLDYIDLYQLHNVKDDASLAKVLAPGGALEALREAQNSGKVRFVGITGHIPTILVKALRTGEFDTVQFPFNPIETSGSTDLLPLAGELNIGTIAMKPFAGGAIKSAVPSLRYILARGFSTVIPGMDDISQIEENVKAGINPAPLTAEEEEELMKETGRLGAGFCRRCEYCQPCPKGIDIPLVFLLDGYWTRYDLKDWAVDRYKPLKVKASECLDCGECESRCPYQLPIREMLKSAAANLEK